jgi:hypothetical protein
VTAVTWLAVMLAGLVVSARTRITAAAGPVHVNVPVLGVVAVGVVLALMLAVLAVVWVLARERLRLRPRMAPAR